MNEISLFPDQAEFVDNLRASISQHQATLGQACTGFGKSVCGAYIAQAAVKKGRSVTFTVPRIQLAIQLGKTMDKYGLQVGFVSAGFTPNPFAPVQIATTDTLAGKLDTARMTDILVADECHVGGERLTAVINAWKQERRRKIIGLSATPGRMDGKGMDTWFEDMVCGPQMRWLIDNGRLNNYRVFTSQAAEDAMKSGAVGEQLDGVMFGDAAQHYKQHAWGLRGLAFCRSRKHAKDTADYFNAAGIPAAAIDGNTPTDEMLRIVMAYARREILVLCNCQIATYGWDLSQLTGMDATVECIFMMKRTKSLPMFMQIVGRMLRVSSRPSIMFDHASTIAEHGLPCDDREWTLDGKLKKKGGGEKTMPVRQCPISEGGCGFVHRPSPCCPNCGRIYPIREVKIDQRDETLIEVSKEEMRQVAKAERQIQGRSETLEDLLALAARTGKKPQWAHFVWRAREAKRRAG
jgi:superfamily II DNA or RNA helicase